MRYILLLFVLALSLPVFSQVGGSGVCHVSGNPNAVSALETQDMVSECLTAIDTLTGTLYRYNPALSVGARWVAVDTDTNTNFANTDLTLTGNRTHELGGNTFRIRDAGDSYPDLFMNGTYSLLGSDANTYLDVGSTAGRARIVAATTAQLTSAANTDVSATDTVTISGQRIRLNAADTRIQQVAKDNALNRVMMIDSTTEQIYYRDVSSISGGGGSGTVTSVTAGTGLTGGTITTTGTISADTAGMLVTKSFLTNQGYTTNTGTVTGTGTTGNFAGWSGAAALTDAPALYDAIKVAIQGGRALQFGTWTTAARPVTPTAGMAGYNSTLGNYDFYGASAWENPARSAYGSGLYTATRIPFADANGRLTDNAGFRVSLSAGSIRLSFGTSAGFGGTDNVFMGRSSGRVAAGDGNNCFGAESGYNLSSGFYNNLYGQGAGAFLTSGYQNNIFGEYAGPRLASYNNNVFGRRAGEFANTSESVFIGTLTGRRVQAANNILIGNSVVSSSDSLFGQYNTVIGSSTAASLSGSAAFNTIIGSLISPPSNTASHQLVISNLIFGTGASGTGTTIAAGSKVGIKVANPARDLEVAGEVRITDLTTDTPTRLVGADADGDLGAITLGSGLSLTSGTLAATGVADNLYTANGTLTGARTVTLGSNALTFSGTSGAPSGVNFGMTPSTNTIALQSTDGSLNNATITVTPARTQMVTINTTGGTAATLEVFADSVKISPTPISLNDALSFLVGINTTTGRLHRVTKSTIAGMADPGSNGILARTAANTTTARTITAGSGIAVTNGDGVSGNPSLSLEFSEGYLSVAGGGTTVTAATPERIDADSPGTATSSILGTEFSVSGSTIDWTGADDSMMKISGTVSFSISDNTDMKVSIYKEGVELAVTEVRVTMVAGDYHTVHLPEIHTAADDNDTFAVYVEPISGTTTTTVHKSHISIKKLY